MKIVSLKFISAFFILVALTGCMKSGIFLRSDTPVDKSKGIVFLSLGYAGNQPPFDAYDIRISSLSTPSFNSSFFVAPHAAFSKKDLLISHNGVTELMALALPPGEYEIDRFDAFTDNGMFSKQVRYAPQPTMKVVVKANEMAYLGSLRLTKVANNYFFMVTNELNRDMEKLESIHPELKGRPVSRAALLQNESIGPLRRW